MKTILFQGDSITDMNRDRSFEHNMGIGYPTMVSGYLGTERPGEFQFLNRGISGDRAINLLNRLDTDVLSLKPDYLSILIGINDVWRKYDSDTGMDVQWYESNYDRLLQQIKEALPDAKIMILEPFVLKASATQQHWAQFRADAEEHAAVAKKLAQKYDLLFVPLMERFDRAQALAPAEYWLYDGVHPTAMGHEIIKRAWLEHFEELEKGGNT